MFLPFLIIRLPKLIKIEKRKKKDDSPSTITDIQFLALVKVLGNEVEIYRITFPNSNLTIK